MGGRGGAPSATTNKPSKAAAPVAETSLTDRLLAAYQSLVTRPNELLSLVRLRHALSDVDRDVLDVELKRLDRARVIQLDPDPNQKALPPEARRDAIRLGGEAKHFLSVVR